MKTQKLLGILLPNLVDVELERDRLRDNKAELLGRIRARAMSIMCDLGDDVTAWHDAKRIDNLCSKALEGGDDA